ncbi:Cro [compost metagenome]|uniref:Cro/Cl family transcriptional regulator n=1 Tax=Pseudomonas sp. PDM27 TaxID=2854769 RepID=UPI000FAD28F4|nr:Cro/Cl family transcriptional regulator [Pseudomonas sp. PDM27]MBV7565582.1 Cro/Cl family transcriptional regulator [Pseudomonas sp. PDM27]
MQRIPLKDFVTKVGQLKAASALRMSQGGISKALKAGREVYVTVFDDGRFEAEEVKPFPGQLQRFTG